MKTRKASGKKRKNPSPKNGKKKKAKKVVRKKVRAFEEQSNKFIGRDIGYIIFTPSCSHAVQVLG
jgi:hypothetical protein